MWKTILFTVAVGSLASSASAMPVLNQANSIARPSIVEDVKVVCDESGQCYRPPGRRLVARWVYADDTFYGPGPYVGPGYYGRPGTHCWSIFGLCW